MLRFRASTKRLEFGLRADTKDLKTASYKGTDRAKADTILQVRPTRPFVDEFWYWCKFDLPLRSTTCLRLGCSKDLLSAVLRAASRVTSTKPVSKPSFVHIIKNLSQ